MVDIGDITGPIALFITLIWWFGVTPKKVTHWFQRYKLLSRILNSRIVNVILPTLFIGLALCVGISRFVGEPIAAGGNKWMVGGFWILLSFYFITRTEERHIRHFVTILTRGISLEILGTIFLVVSTPLLLIGLNTPLRSALLIFAYAVGTTAIIMVTLIFIVGRFKGKTAK